MRYLYSSSQFIVTYGCNIMQVIFRRSRNLNTIVFDCYAWGETCLYVDWVDAIDSDLLDTTLSRRQPHFEAPRVPLPT